MKLATAAVLLLLTPVLASAQENPLSAHAKVMHNGMKLIVGQSAERMPTEHYSFRPTDAVRTYAQILGHIADAQYLFCAPALGEKDPALQIEKTKSTKPEVIAALRDAFAYCDRAYNSVTDAGGVQPVSFRGKPIPTLSVLGTNHIHTALHYGNLVTYMRMKNVVPPSSDPALVPQPKK